MRPDDGGYYMLDEVGALIWGLCDGTRSLEEVIAAAGARLERSPAAAAGEVREWIAELRVERLLLERGSPG